MLERQTQRRSLALIDQQPRETSSDKQSSPVTSRSAILLTDRIVQKENLEQENTRLRQELLAVTQERDIFLSTLSHELRNPLTAVIGWVQLLQAGKLKKSAMTQGLEVIYRSAQAQSYLIDDILDISRIATGKLHLNPQPLDLGSVINKVVESVQVSADTKSIQLVSQPATTTIVGDVQRLQQILWNLLFNAIKFTPAGGQVKITLAAVKNNAEIRVSDTGLGIVPELLPYVFDRFRQGDYNTTTTFQGLGLGLSIVRHLVELHGGTIRAESPGAGQGTTLILQLPLRR
jgi:two-component system, chemotaxis family, CheB/CheR fusion protein